MVSIQPGHGISLQEEKEFDDLIKIENNHDFVVYTIHKERNTLKTNCWIRSNVLVLVTL